MQTLETFIPEHRIGFSLKRADANPNMEQDAWHATARHWRCVLKCNGRRMTVPFSQGSAITYPPSLADVLDCLASDAVGYENTGSFAEWASEYGYDTDSRKAEAAYRIIGRQATSLKRLLGDAAYQALLFATERL